MLVLQAPKLKLLSDEPEKHYEKSSAYDVDWTCTSYLLAAGALGHKIIKVENLNLNSTQDENAIINILQLMGAKLEIENNAIIVKPSLLNAIEIDMGSCNDLVPTVAVLAACAEGITKIKNVKSLRISENDCIASLESELSKLSIRIKKIDDGLIIQGSGFMPCIEDKISFCTYNDYRIAMSLSLFSLNGADISLDNKDIVEERFLNYWSTLEKMCSKKPLFSIR